jgi:hypothetical protein
MARRFTDHDLDLWTRRGLISAEQRDAILREIADRPSSEPVLQLTTLLYYGGGLLILIAYGIFLGLQWESMASGWRIAISSGSLIFFAVVSNLLLRSEAYRLPGELLQVVTIAIVPLFVFALLDAAGIWPEETAFVTGARHDEYETDLAWARMGLAGAALAASAAGFARSRSPFVLLAGVVALGSLLLDASMLAQGVPDHYEWTTPQYLLVAGLGAALLGAGFGVQGRTERDYTIWLYLAGLVALGVGLVPVVFADYAAAGWGVLWMIVALTITVLSVPLQERLFAAAGLTAVFAYLTKLVFEVFESANAALVLVLLGVAILGIGVLYQRYGGQLFARARG